MLSVGCVVKLKCWAVHRGQGGSSTGIRPSADAEAAHTAIRAIHGHCLPWDSSQVRTAGATALPTLQER
jgi:hypothetical protein